MALRRNPSIYEIHTAVWLTELSRRYGRPVTLGDIPAEVIDELVSWGFDAVWMMGVWERSPRAREIGLKHPDLMAEYTRVLPGWTSRRFGSARESRLSNTFAQPRSERRQSF